YGETEVQTLRFIKRARDLGFSLDRIRTLIGLWKDKDRKSHDVKRLAHQYIAELRSEEHTSELQSRENLVCRLLLEKKKSATLYQCEDCKSMTTYSINRYVDDPTMWTSFGFLRYGLSA